MKLVLSRTFGAFSSAHYSSAAPKVKLRTALKCSAVQYRGDTVENQLIHFCTAVSYRGVVVLSVVSNTVGYNMVDVACWTEPFVSTSLSPTSATVGGSSRNHGFLALFVQRPVVNTSQGPQQAGASSSADFDFL